MSSPATLQRARQVSWGNAALGGALGLVLSVLFALVVVDPLANWLAPFGRTVNQGLMILVLALFRVVAGMWTAQLVRRRYEVRRRREFLPTALVAAVIGWAGYVALVLASGAALGTSDDLPRLLLDVLQWLAEFALGAYLVNPDQPAPGAGWRTSGSRSGR